MTPGDVIDQILRDERFPANNQPEHFAQHVLQGKPLPVDERGELILMWAALVDVLRHESGRVDGKERPKHTPLTPHEVVRIKRALRIFTDSVNAAHALHPDHFYVVPEGGR